MAATPERSDEEILGEIENLVLELRNKRKPNKESPRRGPEPTNRDPQELNTR